LIDEYEFVVHPRLAAHEPTLFAGLSKRIDLTLVSRLEFGSGAVAMRYEPRRQQKGLTATKLGRPEMRPQRTRSAPAALRSPLTRRPIAFGSTGRRAI
jgi:hypothetical protein